MSQSISLANPKANLQVFNVNSEKSTGTNISLFFSFLDRFVTSSSSTSSNLTFSIMSNALGRSTSSILTLTPAETIGCSRFTLWIYTSIPSDSRILFSI